MPYQKQKEHCLRQFNIIKRLYALEELQGSLVAQEYGVSARTLLRDMKKIATIIPLLGKHGKWSLDTAGLSEDVYDLNHLLLNAFASNIDIKVSCLEKSTLNDSRISFAIDYNKLPKILGGKIVDALQKEVKCSFLYMKPDGSSQRVVDPVKLYTQDESWYLIARDHKDDRVKTFLLSKMKHFDFLNKSTTLTDAMLQEAEKISSSIWHSSDSREVKVELYVKPAVAHYIQERKLHKTQVVADRHYDGGLEIHCTITHKLEILPAIKGWLPHIHILEPAWLREDLMKDLKYYQDEGLEMDI